MRILIINSAYKQGSTGKIVDCISTVLRENGHSVFVCYGVGANYYDEYSKKVCSNVEHKINALKYRIDGLPYGGFHFSNRKIQQIIKKFNPDVVNLHCINASMVNIYQLLFYLANNNIKTVVSLHAEFMYTGGCDHAFECEQWKSKCLKCPSYKQKIGTWFFDRANLGWRKMYRAFSMFKSENIIVTAVSPWLASRAKESSILRNFRIECVPNGLDISIFHNEKHEAILDRDKYEKLILFVTPNYSNSINDLKGGRYILELAAKCPSYKFVVVCSRCSSRLNKLPENVLVYGRAKSQYDLAKMYSEADATLVLSKRETFSMVTAESLCCGTPVVGFEAGGPESITIPQYSKFVEYGNIDVLVSAIKEVCALTFNKSLISKSAMNSYSSALMANKYERVYWDLIAEKTQNINMNDYENSNNCK